MRKKKSCCSVLGAASGSFAQEVGKSLICFQLGLWDTHKISWNIIKADNAKSKSDKSEVQKCCGIKGKLSGSYLLESCQAVGMTGIFRN